MPKVQEEVTSKVVKHSSHTYQGCCCGPFMNTRAPVGEDYVPTACEHIANCVTHVIPAFLSIIALVFMIYETKNSHMSLLAALPYGVGMFLTFAVSTTYHFSFFMGHSWTLFLNKCDHAIIYLFIASHYFPWILMTDVGQNNFLGGWFLLFISVIAVVGVVKTITGRFNFVSGLVLYFSMGIVGLFLGRPMMVSSVSIWAVVGMLIGALLYAIGVIAFKMDGVIPFAHAIWHLFVAAAAWVHFHAIFFYVICMNISGEMSMKDIFV